MLEMQMERKVKMAKGIQWFVQRLNYNERAMTEREIKNENVSNRAGAGVEKRFTE